VWLRRMVPGNVGTEGAKGALEMNSLFIHNLNILKRFCKLSSLTLNLMILHNF
jgi:hypothetical protein